MRCDGLRQRAPDRLRRRQHQQRDPDQRTAASAPDNIYVYTFDTNPDQVKLDNGGMLKKIEGATRRFVRRGKTISDAIAVREQWLTKSCINCNRWAARDSFGHPRPGRPERLLVQGSFDTIDAGNRPGAAC